MEEEVFRRPLEAVGAGSWPDPQRECVVVFVVDPGCPACRELVARSAFDPDLDNGWTRWVVVGRDSAAVRSLPAGRILGLRDRNASLGELGIYATPLRVVLDRRSVVREVRVTGHGLSEAELAQRCQGHARDTAVNPGSR